VRGERLSVVEQTPENTPGNRTKSNSRTETELQIRFLSWGFLQKMVRVHFCVRFRVFLVNRSSANYRDEIGDGLRRFHRLIFHVSIFDSSNGEINFPPQLLESNMLPWKINVVRIPLMLYDSANSCQRLFGP